MNFTVENLKVDLGTTPIENMFLNTYLGMVDGENLKFYLLVYKDMYNEGSVDIDKIKKILKYSDEDIKNAIDYWINMGAFRKKLDINGREYIEIVSFRQMIYGDNKKTYDEVNEASFDKSSRKQIMFNNVENIIGRALTPADITRIHETIEEYNSDPELITEAFRQAKELNNVDVKYVMGFIKTWRDQNILSVNDLKIHQERQKLVRKKSPRQYKKNNRKISSGDDYKSYAEEARKKRFEKMIEQGKSNENIQ
ncbi:DnaD domain-containing protein [Anaerococcus urinomassiliensis]|uniref:DnaD domain-containing protein n=1 Tax=Anaerococcus urinomassiliensis TaxID=1745712 RepID=UPI000A72B4D0|nr:DnaD domain protein [Anaerococcus urinomassiliensis]